MRAHIHQELIGLGRSLLWCHEPLWKEAQQQQVHAYVEPAPQARVVDRFSTAATYVYPVLVRVLTHWAQLYRHLYQYRSGPPVASTLREFPPDSESELGPTRPAARKQLLVRFACQCKDGREGAGV